MVSRPEHRVAASRCVTVRVWLAVLIAICDGGPVDELVEVLVEVEDRLKRCRGPSGSSREPARPSRSPERRSSRSRRSRSARKMMTHSPAASLRRHAAPLEPFEQRHQRDRDHQRRGHRHEEFGAGAQREGQRDDRRRCPRSASDEASSRSRLAVMASASTRASSPCSSSSSCCFLVRASIAVSIIRGPLRRQRIGELFERAA